MTPRIFKGRKLLIASIGVAAVNYACAKEPPPGHVGNLMGPTPYDSGAPAPTEDAQDAGIAPATPSALAPGATLDHHVTSGNLMPPPPRDAGSPADAGKKKL